MIVYQLRCKCCDKSYFGKTQRYFKTRTAEHFADVWKVIEHGRAKYGDNWWGSGGYSRADAFAKHFADHCRESRNSNAVRAKLKEIVEPSILWQGDRIRCMKSARSYNCKICMVERKEILKRMEEDKSSVINDNSDIFSSCKCGSSFHKFDRYVETTLRTRLTQKKSHQFGIRNPNASASVLTSNPPHLCVNPAHQERRPNRRRPLRRRFFIRYKCTWATLQVPHCSPN